MNKKRKIALGCVPAICLIACSALLALTGCANTKWNVSADSASDIEAKLVKNDQGYKLIIKGSGNMKDFGSKNDVPWYDYADSINEIYISEGIKNVGARAFTDINNVEYVILPSSIASAGAEFAEDELKIFAYSNDINYGGEEPENLYIYREENIKTNDKYWQSDKSSGDIISANDDLFEDEGNFWRFNKEGVAYEYVKLKVLFIGNSFTYRNGVVEFSSGVPGIFDNIAEDLGYAVETYSVTGPGWYLDGHANASDVCGKQVDKILNARDDFDYIVLQDQSTVAFENYSRFLNGIKALQTKINSTQKKASIYLYETWGSPFSANERNITVPEMEMKLREAYTRAGEECNVNVSYIGKAFTEIYNKAKSINLYASDNRHQGYPGAYLSACVHVESMLGGDVRKTEFVGEEKYSAPVLNEETLTALKTAAHNAVAGTQDEVTPPSDNNQTENDSEQEQILKVACWGRFMKENKFNELIADFKNYCSDNGIEYKQIIGTYYQGETTNSPYYYIANFTAKVYQDGNPDVVLPCADNFNANQSTLAAVKLLEINVYNQSNRRVAALNDDELTKKFFEYISTDSAKMILAKQD